LQVGDSVLDDSIYEDVTKRSVGMTECFTIDGSPVLSLISGISKLSARVREATEGRNYLEFGHKSLECEQEFTGISMG
jgi:hypothetical protein